MGKIKEMQNAMPSSSMQANTTITIDQPSNAVFNFFASFVVPKSFEFPRDCTLFHAWQFWLKGSVFRRSYNGKIEQYQLLPYRKFTPRTLPTKRLKNQFKLNWRPICKIMEDTPGLVIPSNPNDITDGRDGFLRSSYEKAVEYLKTSRASFIFSNPRSNPLSWFISTWSKNVTRSMVMSKGSDSDIAALPLPNYHNRPHDKKRTYTSGLKLNNKAKRRSIAASGSRSSSNTNKL